MLYVEELIAPGVINTMPEATLRAFADHGDASRGFGASSGEETLGQAEDAGIDIAAIASELEREGVRSFCDSYQQLLDCIETAQTRLDPLQGANHAQR